jgi:hypothetical protein
VLERSPSSGCLPEANTGLFSAALKIKKSFPHLQVAIYDSVTNSRTLVTLPIASK